MCNDKVKTWYASTIRLYTKYVLLSIIVKINNILKKIN